MQMNAQYIIGQVYEEKGDLTVAAQEYLKVTYAHMSAPAGALMARMKAGRIYEKLEQWQDAVGVYQKIVDNHGDSRFGQIAALRIEAIQKKLEGKGDETEEEQEPSVLEPR
jgi:TolA-binding protein